MTIESVAAREILDSRGRPTLWARCRLSSGCEGSASVPSGASTGRAEARELRDGDPHRYRGWGCRKAVDVVNCEIGPSLRGVLLGSQTELDHALIELDGTPDKSRLGANSILAVSLAFARARARQEEKSFFDYLSALAEHATPGLPRPMINLFSGGKHAGRQVSIQDVLVVPLTTQTIEETLATTYEIYQSAAELIYDKYGSRALTADEGGLAPPAERDEDLLEDAVEAIRRAGQVPGQEVGLALDVAASHFFEGERYALGRESLDGAELVARLLRWTRDYPILALEDGLAEEDWKHWKQLRQQQPPGISIIGDDLLCTHPGRIRKAIREDAVTALLLKVNQIGTLTEAARSARLARKAGWKLIASARSGETEDHWLADLAVGWQADMIKIGSITQSERLSKYNRLLAIEGETGMKLEHYGKEE